MKSRLVSSALEDTDGLSSYGDEAASKGRTAFYRLIAGVFFDLLIRP